MSKRFALRRLRRNCKGQNGRPLTQQDAALLIGVSYSTIQKWEAGLGENSDLLPSYEKALRALRKDQITVVK